MNRLARISLTILITVIFCWFLFFPWSKQVWEDGCTVTYSSLTYRIYVWKTIGGKQTTEIQYFPAIFKSKTSGRSVAGEDKPIVLNGNERITYIGDAFSAEDISTAIQNNQDSLSELFPDGDIITVSFKGAILESDPQQIPDIDHIVLNGRGIIENIEPYKTLLSGYNLKLE